MPIKVRFRGPMLFVTDRPAGDEITDRIDRVVIPDSENQDLDTLGDGIKVTAHTAGLVVTQNGQTRHIILEGAAVEISSEGGSQVPGVTKEFLAVPPLHEMINPGGKAHPVARKRSPATRVSTVTFKGGLIDGELLSAIQIELARYKQDALPWRIASMPVWQSDADAGTITISRNGRVAETIRLDAATEVFVYNWDTERPEPKELERPLDIKNRRFQDDDFKLVYDLLKPPKATWAEWLGDEKYLPAPRSLDYLTTPEPANDGDVVGTSGDGYVSTCDTSRIRGLPVVD